MNYQPVKMVYRRASSLSATMLEKHANRSTWYQHKVTFVKTMSNGHWHTRKITSRGELGSVLKSHSAKKNQKKRTQAKLETVFSRGEKKYALIRQDLKPLKKIR